MEKLLYNFEKTTQAAGVLLSLDDGQMGRMRLLKLMYIADRELLAETGRSITGDTGHALPKGPVLTRTYDYIKGGGANRREWNRFFQSLGHRVRMIEDPGRGKLSRDEMEKLNEVSNRYRDMDDEDLSKLTHEFREWIVNQPNGVSSAQVIPWPEILEAQGKSDMIEAAEDQAKLRKHVSNLLRHL